MTVIAAFASTKHRSEKVNRFSVIVKLLEEVTLCS